MGIDGAFIHLLANELTVAVGGIVDKIYQPYRDQLMLLIRTKGGEYRLLITSKSDAARVQFTHTDYPNPPAPPMLCMLLRKLLGGARLTGVRQADGLERIIFLEFTGKNELGDKRIINCAVEMMGRRSNAVFFGEDGIIIDALKRIDDDISSVRPIFPGLKYCLPPAVQKLSVLDALAPDTVGRALREGGGRQAVKVISDTIQGLCPNNFRELCHRACVDPEAACSSLDSAGIGNICNELNNWAQIIVSGKSEPTVVFDSEGLPKEFSFTRLTHMVGAARTYHDSGELLDAFFFEKERAERRKGRSRELFKLLNNALERAERKLAGRREELEQTKNADSLRLCGDLVTANLYAIKKGQAVLNAVDYTDPEQKSVEIALRCDMTPVQNAGRYYKLYKKSVNAAKELTGLIKSCEEEIVYLQSVIYLLSSTDDDADIAELRAELAGQGYLKKSVLREKVPKTAPVRRFVSSSGFAISVGRNNKQNDILTFKTAQGNDIWFHTKNIPGSHVVLSVAGREPDDVSLTEAAQLAAFYSSAKPGSPTAVDYTAIKRVKKPSGARPGFVNYFDYKTAFVTADPEIVKRLKRD